MKRIRQLEPSSCALQPLASYVAELAERNELPDWERFRDNARNAYEQLTEALWKAQQGICAYCEIQIDLRATLQVEHYLPKDGVPDRHLAVDNLMACCGVSDNPGYAERRDAVGQGHYLPPTAMSKCCGAAKGNHDPAMKGTRVLDPRAIPSQDPLTGALPKLVGWRLLDNEIELVPDLNGCRRVGIDPELVNETILTLNLNNTRHKRLRKTVRDGLKKTIGLDLSQQSAAENLSPNPVSNRINRYWSTIRHYFGDFAEDWLKTDEAIRALC